MSTRERGVPMMLVGVEQTRFPHHASRVNTDQDSGGEMKGETDVEAASALPMTAKTDQALGASSSSGRRDLPSGGTTSTGIGVRRRIRSATLPMKNWSSPLRPCVDRTVRFTLVHLHVVEDTGGSGARGGRHQGTLDADLSTGTFSKLPLGTAWGLVHREVRRVESVSGGERNFLNHVQEVNFDMDR